MRVRGKNNYLFPVTGLAFLLSAVGVVVSIPPRNFLVETMVLVLIGSGLWMICLIFAGRKRAFLISLGTVMIIILNRFGVLEPLTLLLLMIVVAGVWLV